MPRRVTILAYASDFSRPWRQKLYQFSYHREESVSGPDEIGKGGAVRHVKISLPVIACIKLSWIQRALPHPPQFARHGG